MFFYEYSVLGLRFLCRLPHPIEILSEAVPFLRPVSWAEGMARPDADGYDLFIRVEQVDALPPVPEDAVFHQSRMYSREGDNVLMHMLPAQGKPPYACTRQRREEKRFDCLFLPGNEDKLRYSRHFSDLVGMETVFLQFEALMLHASFIRWRDQGILFTAPSGTGKSTQAALWEEAENAHIINGDRAGLRPCAQGWRAYGLPYAGSSGIYRNESAPVRAIVVLRQAGENRIRALRPGEAVRLLFPETAIHRWDRSFVEKAMDLLAELAGTVPMYMLECRPDRGAVELLKNTLLK